MGRVGGLEAGGWKVGGLEVEGLVVFFKKKVRRLMHRRLLAWDEEILGDQSDCNWWKEGRMLVKTDVPHQREGAGS